MLPTKRLPPTLCFLFPLLAPFSPGCFWNSFPSAGELLPTFTSSLYSRPGTLVSRLRSICTSSLGGGLPSGSLSGESMGENRTDGFSAYCSLGVCEEEGTLMLPSESDDDESTISRDFLGAFLRLSGAGRGEEVLGSFLMLGLRGPLLAARALCEGISGEGSVSTFSPPFGSSTTGGFSGFLGCFLPTTRRPP